MWNGSVSYVKSVRFMNSFMFVYVFVKMKPSKPTTLEDTLFWIEVHASATDSHLDILEGLYWKNPTPTESPPPPAERWAAPTRAGRTGLGWVRDANPGCATASGRWPNQGLTLEPRAPAFPARRRCVLLPLSARVHATRRESLPAGGAGAAEFSGAVINPLPLR